MLTDGGDHRGKISSGNEAATHEKKVNTVFADQITKVFQPAWVIDLIRIYQYGDRFNTLLFPCLQ
jgi:hypothetical protein